MITSGQPYGYSGRIPCQSCRHFTVERDNYEPTEAKTATVMEKFLKHAKKLDW